ncbi:MAG: leucyl/phenylalanyl-tRNA--protein transferase [Proteobacteria bacterium]|nr:leucyl/phenylalanyl-tRNA--protein transferase [Pseudomonadota bacterium]
MFPWPTEGLPLLWYFPKKRGVLDFEELHVPKRLVSFLRSRSWRYTVDQAFERVIEACSHRGETGTWILPEMKTAYCELHRRGYAHSVEVWEGEELIGGVYGVDVANTFAGESMFHRESNASKAALVCSVGLQKKVGRTWMDIQVISPHMEAMGAKEIPGKRFSKRIEEERAKIGTGSPFTPGKPATYGDFCSFIE